MKFISRMCIGLSIIVLIISCKESKTDQSATHEWSLTPFTKQDLLNPVLLPDPGSEFYCPIWKETVHWEEKDVFNPSAVVRNGKVWLLYRAEDTVGKYNGTSRLGVAVSADGYHFIKHPQPVFYPNEDSVKKYEWEGGCEDPRLVEDESGRYILTYTAYDGETARLMLASSRDLIHWQKYGPLFRGKDLDMWSKSGAIVCRREGSRMIAVQIKGKYWMYWGDTDIFLASSDDLQNWEPIRKDNGDLMPIFGPRTGKFDSDLVEPGPAPLLTEQGILLIYNSRNANDEKADPNIPPHTYTAGQILLDPEDPTKVLKRLPQNFIRPEKDYEITGQVNKVCFVEGLIYFKEKWFLYYGTADSKIAVAVCDKKLAE